jgi:thiol-disulfide isomerase/thioredoxin
MKKIINLVLLNLVFIPAIAFSLTWDLEQFDGTKKSIEDYKGQWVIVNFWATWCPPCREEIPELISFHDNNKGKAVVLGVNQENLSVDDLNKFVEEYFIEYPQFKVSPNEKLPVGSISGLPTTFVISPKGDVVAKQVGQIDEAMLTDFIRDWKEK